jgi:hypothetical protein
MTFQQQRLFRINVELGLNRFVAVANAGGVGTLDYVVDDARQLHLVFLYDLVVTNDVDAGVGRDQCYLVHFLRFQFSSFNLNDVLSFQALARYIDGYRDRCLFLACDPQDSNDVQSVSAGNVINYGTILNFGNPQFSFGHLKLLLKKNLMQQTQIKDLT